MAAMATTLQAAADAFYEAGNRLLAGDATAFAAIWSEADDISHMGPTGDTVIGRQAVMEQFARESAMGFAGPLVADERRYVETGAPPHRSLLSGRPPQLSPCR